MEQEGKYQPDKSTKVDILTAEHAYTMSVSSGVGYFKYMF